MVDIQAVTTLFKTKLHRVGSTSELEKLKIEYLGRNGKINSLLKGIKNIDSDYTAIKEKANEIVAGETDSLRAMTNIAKFVSNYLEYDKEYIPVIKKASWVYENKRGVCDEYTNLVIAMARVVGFPARYVTGVAFSSADKSYSDKGSFQNHAWAEVYIPGHGWVPFDATFNQYGWVDATHVAMSKTKDTITSITYSYEGNSKIDATPLSITAEITGNGDKLQKEIIMDVKLLKNNVKVRSYVPLEIELKNNNEYYVPVTAYLTKAPGVYKDNTYETILSPGETEKAFLIIDTGENAKEGYAYEATVEVKTQDGNIGETKLLFSKDYGDQTTLSDAINLIDILKGDITVETGRIEGFVKLETYINNWQILCSNTINRTLEPKLVCEKIYYFIIGNNYSYTNDEIFSLRENLSKIASLSVNLINHYIANYDSFCYDKQYSGRLPSRKIQTLTVADLSSNQDILNLTKCDVKTGSWIFDISFPFIKIPIGNDLPCWGIELWRTAFAIKVGDVSDYQIVGIKIWGGIAIVLIIVIIRFLSLLKAKERSYN